MAMSIDEKKRRQLQAAQAATRKTVQPSAAMPTTGAVARTTTAQPTTVQNTSPALTSTGVTGNTEATKNPGAYQSPYQSEIDRLYQQIVTQKPFQFDVSGNPLYQQYQDYYTRAGQQAMRDTMGQAASLTGGYGSSYGQNVGQQAYNAYMQQLAGTIPELYETERAAYDAEMDRLYQQYAMLQDREDTAYGRYLDDYDRWFAEQQAAQNQANWEREFAYSTSRGSGSSAGSSAEDYVVDDYMSALAQQMVDAGVGVGELRTELAQYYEDVDDDFVSFFWDYMQTLTASKKKATSHVRPDTGEIYTGW